MLRNWRSACVAFFCLVTACADVQGPVEDVPVGNPTEATAERAVRSERSQQALRGNNAAGMNLAGMNQGGVNQGGVNQGGINQAGVNQGGVNLGGANLGGTNLGGANLAGANQAGVNQAGANLGGANLGGANLCGNNLSGGNLGGANIGGANLGGANLGGANLAGANLGGANLAGANLGGANQAGVNQAGSNLGGANLGGANLGGTNLGGANLAGANLGGANFAGSNLGGANLGGANLVAPNVSGTNFGPMSQVIDMHWPPGQGPAAGPGQTLAAKMLYSGEDAWAGVPAQGKNPCVVLGIGSTAFARLVNANKPTVAGESPYMYATLKKLPWGFTDTYQGDMKARAWEVVVWGQKTYCSFVVLSPITNGADGGMVDADPRGVAGFVKSIFRWAAPPTQFLITKYNAGDGVTGPETTYPNLTDDGYAAFNGMMNAVSFAESNPEAYVAGLVNFAASTTNNVSVNVDFASSITLPDAGLQILANVDPSSARYYEGRWSTFNIDGVTSLKHIQADSSTTHSTKYGVPDTSTITWSAYRAWQAGLIATKPVARRCSTAIAMQNNFNVPIPPGKCDDAVGLGGSAVWKNRNDGINSLCSAYASPLDYLMGNLQFGVRPPPDTTWTKALGGNPVTANAYMEGSHICSYEPVNGGYLFTRRIPVAETHIHSADFPLELGNEDWIIADHRYMKPSTFTSDPAVATQVLSPSINDIVRIYDLGAPGSPYPADSAFVDWYYASTCTRTAPTAAQVLKQNACVPKFHGRVDPEHAQYRLFKNNAATASNVTWDIGVTPSNAGLNGNSMTVRHGAVRAGERLGFQLSHSWTTPTPGSSNQPIPWGGSGTMPSTVSVGLYAYGAADSSPIVSYPPSALSAGYSGVFAQGEFASSTAWLWSMVIPASVAPGAYQLRALDNGVKFATSEAVIVTNPSTGDYPTKKLNVAAPPQIEVGDCVSLSVFLDNADYLVSGLGLTASTTTGGTAGGFAYANSCENTNVTVSPTVTVSDKFGSSVFNTRIAVRATAVGTLRITPTYNTAHPDCTNYGAIRCPAGVQLQAPIDIPIVAAKRTLQFTGPSASGGACTDLNIARMTKNNLVATDATSLDVLLRAPNGTFHSDASCTSTPITSIAIAAGQALSPTFYFKKVDASTMVSAMAVGAFSASTIVSGNAASFVSQTGVPTSMTSGYVYPVTIAMRNMGTTTWAAGTDCGSVRLVPLGISDGALWGPTQVNLSSAVAPGATATFSFNVLGPSAVGTFTFQWGLVQACLGQFGTPATAVVTTVAAPYNGATLVSSTLPTGTWEFSPTPFSVTVVYKNSGTTTWPTTFSLGIDDASQNMGVAAWGAPASVPITAPVAPGGTVSFSFTVTPVAPTTYPTIRALGFRILTNSGSISTSQVTTQVIAPIVPNAIFTAQTLQTSYRVSANKSFSVTVKNTGTNTWVGSQYSLGVVGPNFTIAVPVVIPSLAPNATATLNGMLRGNSVQTSVPLQFKMYRNGVAFGTASTAVNKAITP